MCLIWEERIVYVNGGAMGWVGFWGEGGWDTDCSGGERKGK